MFSGLRSRVPSHTTVVAYLALFLVLTGGTAVALTGSNTVFSDDITNGEVKNADVGTNAIGGGKVIDNSLTGNDVAGLAGGDLSPKSIGARELKDTVQANGSTAVAAGGEGSARAECPARAKAIHGGGYWNYNSGWLSGIRNYGNGIVVNGRNTGHSSQYLLAFALCLPY